MKTIKHTLFVSSFNTLFPYSLEISAKEFNDLVKHYKTYKQCNDDNNDTDHEWTISIKKEINETEKTTETAYYIRDNDCATTITLREIKCKNGYGFKPKNQKKKG